MKRFYKDVAVSEDRGILLDGRPVKTPARAALLLPNDALANAVAEEWRAQGEEIDPRSMPFTGLANAAIDRVAANPNAFAAGLAQYGETELLCYRAERPPELIARQTERWDPLLDWAKTQYDVDFVQVAGIMHQPQPMTTLLRLGDAIAAANPFALAALSPIVTIGGSLVLALGVYEEAVLPHDAFDLAHLDELWQAELWGEDDFALATRAAHRRDFIAACQFLELLRAA
jgi:chaperone required for assembly of F1-ATPase